MNINANIIETSHNLDSLIAAARLHPTENLIQKIIDKGIDPNGNHCQPAFCAFVWRKAFNVQAGRKLKAAY